MRRKREDDLRHFIRDVNLRAERFTQEAIRTLEANTRSAENLQAEIREHTRQMVKDHEELREEMRAQRRALFRILDRLDGNGGPAPAT